MNSETAQGAQRHAGIVVENCSKSYERGKIRVLEAVNLQIKKGQTVALLGASGSGKTTLLNIIGGLDLPDHGRIDVFGIDPTDERQRLQLRRQYVGYVFQLHHLIPYLTVRENMLIPSIGAGLRRSDAQQRVMQLAEQLGIAHRLEQRMQDLSGGERQRTAIGRALVCRPKVLLADEPTGALDEATGNRVFELMQRLAQQERVTVILATHERRFAEACERIIRVRQGVAEEITA